LTIRQQASLGLLLLRQRRGSLSITTNETLIYHLLMYKSNLVNLLSV